MRIPDLVIENANLIWRNFSGAPGKFTPAGVRTFNVILNEQMVDELSHTGWNIKTITPKTPDTDPMYVLPVAVNYKNYPPKIVLVKSTGKTLLDESDLSILDFATFTNVDLLISPYQYDFNGRQGIKAYLRSGYFTIYEDMLEQKYRDVPDSAMNAITPNLPF